MTKMKKLMSLALATAMMMSLIVPAFAENSITAQHLNTYQKESTIKASTNIDGIMSWFSDATAGTQYNMAQNANTMDLDILYDYTITNRVEENLMDVSLDFLMRNNGVLFPIHVEGIVEVTQLSENRTYVIGPLYGMVAVDNLEYEVIVGFQKVLEEEAISAGVTIDCLNDPSQKLVAFFFGDFMKDDDILALENTTMEQSYEITSSYSTNSNSVEPIDPTNPNFIHKSTKTTTMSGTNVTDQIVKTYWNNDLDVIVATTNTNLAGVRPQITMAHAIMTSSRVEKVYTRFDFIQQYNEAVFDGWYNISAENDASVSLIDVFEFLLEALGYSELAIGASFLSLGDNGRVSSAKDAEGQWQSYTAYAYGTSADFNKIALPIAAKTRTASESPKSYQIKTSVTTTYIFTFDLGTMYHTTNTAICTDYCTID